MSDQFLVVVPADPKAPLPDTAGALRIALANIAGTEEARIKDYGKLQFIDCGENAEAIHCSSCGAEISALVWLRWMDEDWHGEDGFHLHRHVTPCCESDLTLNDLEYRMPQGFARFVLEATNPSIEQLPEHLARSLSAALGCEIRAIWARY